MTTVTTASKLSANRLGGARASLADALALTRQQKVVLVVDLVESVRLMQSSEADVVQRWQVFSHRAAGAVLPRHEGRLVKSLGDGLLAEFDSARQALKAVFDLHDEMSQISQGLGNEQAMRLRAGIHSGEVFLGEADIYGANVNIAARLASLAAPGETVASATVRDCITDGLDAQVSDLGECYLKHVQQPVRAFQVGRCGAPPRSSSTGFHSANLAPAVAVVPFDVQGVDPSHAFLGELIADGVIGHLCHVSTLRVISRLSTTALRGSSNSLILARQQLQADFVLSGTCVVDGDRLMINAELAEVVSQTVVGTRRLTSHTSDLLQADSEIVAAIGDLVREAVIDFVAVNISAKPLPTLSSSALMLGGIVLTHRCGRQDFQKAYEVFSYLSERLPRHAVLPGWIAKWHVLRIAQGWAADAQVAARQALDLSNRALDLDPDCALALTIDGFVRSDLFKDFDTAMCRYEAAIQINPNEPLAWLFKGLLHGYQGEALAAIEGVDRALSLSPLDPSRYFFDSLAASAYLAANQPAMAVEMAQRSIRANASHASTLRVLVISQVLVDNMDAARDVVKKLMGIDPGFTVSQFLSRRSEHPFSEMSRVCADALLRAGVPAA